MKSLPIGIQTFSEIREKDALYIDKTKYLWAMISEVTKGYFLSRPRRFGKSRAISTLEAFFQGKKDLFKGLWIENVAYDWPVHPVIRLDMSKISSKEGCFEEGLKEQLGKIGSQHKVEIDLSKSIPSCTGQLIEGLSRTEKVVILIDEYDNPIISHLENLPIAKENRNTLSEFYKTIKALDEHLRFVFVTGISKFSQVSVFSGANQLTDLTMIDRYSTMLGYTQEELEANFSDRIEALSQKMEKTKEETLKEIKHWYNGYRFSKEDTRVYNPFSTLKLLEYQDFSDYWFESGTPTFLTHLVKERGMMLTRKDLHIKERIFSTYDPENLNLIAVLFQTGYLTIEDYNRKTTFYRLNYPNYEVRSAWLDRLLSDMCDLMPGQSESYVSELIGLLKKGELTAFFELLSNFFARIPYGIQLKQEKYYQTIFYSLFLLIGLEVKAEAMTNLGRIDAVIVLSKKVYLFEFKLHGTAEEALDQIETMDYARAYVGKKKSVIGVGVSFDATERNIGRWVEKRL